MESADAAFAFAALGQATRVDLLRALLAAGPSGLAAGEIAARLGVPASTLSFYLRALDQAGLVAATRQGRSLIYAVQVARLRALLAFLAEACCGGEPVRCGDLGRMLDTLTRENDTMQPPTFNVLFLCTHNSARSIMAEALLKKLAPGRFAAWSAGSDPSPTGPLPEVMQLLKALGHDVSGLRSKSWASSSGPWRRGWISSSPSVTRCMAEPAPTSAPRPSAAPGRCRTRPSSAAASPSARPC
jgi:ArsR family transcriptional regulator, arsenate/arsenite/antimonite-responsive transcriptional repressor / arsenate reductase (thioredoxin)